jgi:hypothetical protein
MLDVEIFSWSRYRIKQSGSLETKFTARDRLAVGKYSGKFHGPHDFWITIAKDRRLV